MCSEKIFYSVHLISTFVPLLYHVKGPYHFLSESRYICLIHDCGILIWKENQVKTNLQAHNLRTFRLCDRPKTLSFYLCFCLVLKSWCDFTNITFFASYELVSHFLCLQSDVRGTYLMLWQDPNVM